MKIKILWGFKTEVGKVPEAENGLVRAGLVTTVDDQYAHELIGRKLAEPYDESVDAAERARKASGVADTSQRTAALDAREAALQQRENEVAQREAQLAQAGGEGTADTDTGGDAGTDAAKPGKAAKSTKPAAPSETK